MSSFYSHEVEEIMSRKPAWILRWGITILIAIIAGTIALCYVIKFPQTVPATISLTSGAPPADLTAKYSGLLDTVCVTSGDSVKQGQLIALIASTTNYYDVTTVERFINKSSSTVEPIDAIMDYLSTAPEYQLGEIQSSWIDLILAYKNYSDYLRIDIIGKEKQLIIEQIKYLKDYYNRLEEQRQILKEDIYFEKNAFVRDSILYSSGVISLSDFEKASQSYITKKNNLASFDVTVANAHLNHIQLEQRLIELDSQKTSEEANHINRIEKALRSLENQIVLWKERYAIISPFKGTVSLQNVWSRGQYVSSGDIIASISPESTMVAIGKAKVSSSGFGKIKVGQEVIIKLNGFPFMEYGILKGVIKSIYPIPVCTSQGVYYTVDVSLSSGLESTYHKTIPFVQNMDGSAEIITEDMRAIEQFTRPILSLLKNK